MASPTPQPESTDLANAALNLPLEATGERERLRWRLGALVRKQPGDEAARLGLMYVAFRAGDRETADAQLAWLLARYRAVETAILSNMAAPLVMVGWLDAARDVLGALAQRRDRPYLDTPEAAAHPETDVVWALLAGDPALARRLAAGFPAAERFLAAVERRDLGRPFGILGAAAAETLGPVVCDLSLDLNPTDAFPGAFLYCAYRAPGDWPARKAVLRRFDRVWADGLAAAGLDEATCLGVLTTDLLPLPEIAPVTA